MMAGVLVCVEALAAINGQAPAAAKAAGLGGRTPAHDEAGHLASNLPAT
jgi:hypothetical protein